MEDLPLAEVFTLVIWSTCALVGMVGLALHYPTPAKAAVPAQPLQAEVLEVQLTDSPVPLSEPAPGSPVVLPSMLPEPTPLRPAPDTVALVEPLGLTFPVPHPPGAPSSVAVSAHGSSAVNRADAVTVPANARVLTFGQGEGRQPAPEYPRQSVREGQEGAVGVRFLVGENGRVLSAEVSQACPWPLLNQAALAAVRERWRFRVGPLRLFEVRIRFQLTR